MTLFSKLGAAVAGEIDALHAKKSILAIHHNGSVASLVLRGGAVKTLPNLTKDNARNLVGYLGFFGGGQNGLDLPAFLVKPEPAADRAAE